MRIISAREAFNKGLTRYFTGKICCHGHIDERMISNGCCVSCLKEKRKRTRQDKYEATKVWRLKNPDARKIEAEKYRAKHPEKVRANAKAYRERNLEKVRERERNYIRRMRKTNPEKEKSRQKKYYERQEKKKIKEAGRPRSSHCEICNRTNCRIVFDHCHQSGEFRGWLCDKCNVSLGNVDDRVDILKMMIKYLEKNNGKVND